MSLPSIIFLYRARLRSRAVFVQECFAILGIAVGVALLFASQVASTSLTHSVTQLDQQIIGHTQFQLDARGPNGFDERLLERARRMPGVQTAFPILEQRVNVIGSRGRRSVDLIGADPRFVHVGGSQLRRFSPEQLAAQQAIVLPVELARIIGARSLQTIKLQIGASGVETLVGATLDQAEIGELVHSPVAIAPVAYAQLLAGMQGRITRIFVRAFPGRDREVRAELSTLASTAGVNLEPADYDSRLFAVAVASQRNSETLFSVISALVGFMFALNAMLITVPARRKLIDSIRPQGATRLVALQILLFDAAVLGVLACALGLVLGELLSLAVFRAAPGYLAFAFPVGNDRVITWQSIVLAVGAGLLAALAGVLWPLRDFLWGSPKAEKISRSQWLSRGAARLAVGSGCVAFTTIVLLTDTRAAIFGNLALVVALVCLLPFLFDGVTALFQWAQRPFDWAATGLAAIVLRTPQTRVRSLAIATTAAVAVFGVVAFQGMQANLASGLDTSAHGIDSNADVWVTPSGEANAFATTPFRDTHAHALAHLPGVAALSLYRGSFLDWGEHRLWVLAPPAGAGRSIFASQVAAGNRALAGSRIGEGGWVALSQALAAEHHLHVGQTFLLPSPRPTRLRVAALITNLGWPPGAIVLNATNYERAWGSGEPSAYEIQTQPGISAGTTAQLVRRALGAQTGLAVETSSERERRHYALAAQGLSRLTQIRLLVLVAAMLAIVGAIGSMLWQRRDLVAFMKIDGYRQGVLWRWLLCESAVLLAAGCSIGAVFGLYAQLVGSHYLSSVTGFPIVLGVEAVAALSGFALVTVIAVAVTAVPGYLVVRVPASAAATSL